MTNGHSTRYVIKHLGEESAAPPQTSRLPLADKTRNTLLILGFGLSAGLMFLTIYPRPQR